MSAEQKKRVQDLGTRIEAFQNSPDAQTALISVQDKDKGHWSWSSDMTSIDMSYPKTKNTFIRDYVEITTQPHTFDRYEGTERTCTVSPWVEKGILVDVWKFPFRVIVTDEEVRLLRKSHGAEPDKRPISADEEDNILREADIYLQELYSLFVMVLGLD